MARLALLVALVGAGVCGWLVGERSALQGQVASLEQAQQAAEARLLQAERALAALGSAPAEPALLAAAPAPEAPAAAPGSAPATAARPGLTAAPRTAAPAPALEERLARLEQDLAKERAARAAPPAAPAWRPDNRFLTSVEQAEKALNLDGAQKAGLERAIEDTTRELTNLASLRGEDGKTLKELQEAMRAPLQQGMAGEEAQARFHENMAALSRFRQGKVPGTSETFAEAERRIRREGRNRARSYLNPEQAKQWDNSMTDPLFRGPGGMEAGTSVVFAASPLGGDSGPVQIQVGR
ncbi:MAG: hypothetical protein ACKOSS_02825 [Planctomycetia bacterium]